MRKLLSVLAIGVILLGACAAPSALPAPAETPTLTPLPTPPAPAPTPAPTTAPISPPPPAEFEVIYLDIKPMEVTTGETVSITAEVKNIGDGKGIYTAVLTIDGVKFGIKEVALAAGDKGTITFTVTKNAPGTYDIQLAGLSGTLEVLKPPPAIPTTKVTVHKYQELALFALELINRDRVANGLDPVVLASNIASQNHAEERLTNVYSSHWGMDGFKPYMRYTLAGGVNYEGENVLGTGTTGSGGGAPLNIRDPKEMLEQAQEKLMESPGHRENILNKWHKKVNLGIAYNDQNLHLVQQFEGDYIDFSELPSISSNSLSMAGKVTLGTVKNISLDYDPLPQPLSPSQLNASPYDSPYGLGETIGNILPPLPPDRYYTNLSPNDVVAMIWEIKPDGSFTVEADISPILEEGNGVYTVVVWVETGGELVRISNYSIFVQ